MFNVDLETGISFGVVSLNNEKFNSELWFEVSEPEYYVETCPICGSGFDSLENDDGDELNVCHSCGHEWGIDEHELVIRSFVIDEDGLRMEQSADDSDIFVTRSPFVTLAAKCSPCAPNAGDLSTPGGVMAYCPPPEWWLDVKGMRIRRYPATRNRRK